MLTIAGTVITISLGTLPFILKQPVDAIICGKLRRMSNQIPMPVHVTAGPTPWDCVVGGCTSAATVVAALAIYLALRAGRDLVEDRRHTFALGVLLDIYEIISRDTRDNRGNTATSLLDVGGLLALLDVLSSAELQATRTYVATASVPLDGAVEDRERWWARREEQHDIPLAEIRTAVRARAT